MGIIYWFNSLLIQSDYLLIYYELKYWSFVLLLIIYSIIISQFNVTIIADFHIITIINKSFINLDHQNLLLVNFLDLLFIIDSYLVVII